ncbi:unnamed protein product [Calypogeia fissa]
MRIAIHTKWIALLVLCFPSFSNAWLPDENKIRGVNLGGQFIIEPWMMAEEWASMGCGGLNDEFSCVQKLGQTSADAAFQKHWASWITQDDITQIAKAGLNTIRIPLGFWIYESLVQPSEFFPRGGFSYLENICDMASSAGLYIILDLHAAPGGQSPNQQFTGRAVSPPGFFNSANYERAYEWLEWITNLVHTRTTFRNVGAIEIVNEPAPGNNSAWIHSLLYEFYPTAWKRIRAVEDNLKVESNKSLHIQMMDVRWGLGYRGQDPNQGLTGINLSMALYDDHHYRAFDCPPTSNNCYVPPTRKAYLHQSCTESLNGNSPLIVGEWSLATSHPDGPQFDINQTDAVLFYRKFFGAQIHTSEKQLGWLFWTWKVNWIGGKDDWRWGYQQAMQAGVIPSTDPDEANNPDVCSHLR